MSRTQAFVRWTIVCPRFQIQREHSDEYNFGSRGVAEEVGFKLRRKYIQYFCICNEANHLVEMALDFSTENTTGERPMLGKSICDPVENNARPRVGRVSSLLPSGRMDVGRFRRVRQDFHISVMQLTGVDRRRIDEEMQGISQFSYGPQLRNLLVHFKVEGIA